MKRAFKRPLIIGAGGQLGNDLMREFADLEPVGPARQDLTIQDRPQVERTLDAQRPDVVVNTAAFHNVERCETDVRQALLVNAIGVQTVALACVARGIPLATISTDYVFDGSKGSPYTEDDEPRPLSAYGMSKLAGELLTASAGPEHFVIRTSGLYGRLGSKTKGYTFIERVLRQAEMGEPLRIVTDMTFSPSYTRHVSAAVRRILTSGEFGIYHVTNAGHCTWYEFALEALRQAGITSRVTPITSRRWPSRARRPANSSLAHERMQQQGLGEVPHWKDGIAAYLKERQ